MNWIPIVFVIFKGVVLVTGMFFAIKWHYDQGKKGKSLDRRALLLNSGKVAAIFAVSLLGLGFFTFELIKIVGLNLNLS